MRYKTLCHMLRTILGLFIFSIGLYITVQVNIGLAPWDVFAMGLSYHLPISYGNALTYTSLCIVVIDLILGERIGLGTVLDAILVGLFMDLFSCYQMNLSVTHLIYVIVLFIFGLFVMALGQYFYMSAQLGCGARDLLLLAIGKRLSKVPIGGVNVFILCVVFIAGILLGGPIGIGTVLATFGMGIAMQLVCMLFHFEPRGVKQEDIFETIKKLFF